MYLMEWNRENDIYYMNTSKERNARGLWWRKAMGSFGAYEVGVLDDN